ncbi:hypothetical protein DFP72DRAFT_900469 [Ephemerocybe angulata]|uniref:Uncharacterized protein n=1 Tax=Ephemerocybe angulata TaxID=980116 RepID=A0A8H6M4B1_9AGAR|nr:hypothetical protein DFP72DRAFT_900469 [Tulosesus angulatus]
MGSAARYGSVLEAGANGLPVLVINGGADKFVDGDKIIYGLLDGNFKDVTLYTVKDGSHGFFYEEGDEFNGEAARFAQRVFASKE